jgi:hypothetical protein
MGGIYNHIGDRKARKEVEMASHTKTLARLDSLVQPFGSFWYCASCTALISEAKGVRNTKCEERGRKRANQGACGSLGRTGAMMRGISVPMIILLINVRYRTATSEAPMERWQGCSR